MKFSNIKKSIKTVALLIVFLASAASLKAIVAASLKAIVLTKQPLKPNAFENKHLECGKKIGVTLALCLFQPNDNRSFLDYINQFRKIITEYHPYFDKKIITVVTKIFNDIETYIKVQYAQGKWVNANKVAALLTQIIEFLPTDVTKQFDKTFEQLQLKLLKRSKPLGTWQLLGPLSKRLNN